MSLRERSFDNFQENQPRLSERETEELAKWGVNIRDSKYFTNSVTRISSNGILTGGNLKDDEPLYDIIDNLIITPESPLYELSKFPPIRRLLGIGQLGPRRDVPFTNLLSRGEHVFQVGIESLKLAIAQDLSKEEQFLAFTLGVLHDSHPPFGDTGKLAYRVAERDLIHLYFNDENTKFWDDWLDRVKKKYAVDISPGQLEAFAHSIVNRQDFSRVGQLVHHPDKTNIDCDTFAYLVGDAIQSGQVLWLIDDQNSKWSGQSEDVGFNFRMDHLRANLSNIDLFASGVLEKIRVQMGEIDLKPHMQFVDGKLVIKNPDVLANILQLAGVFYEYSYLHPNNLALETLIAAEIAGNPKLYPSLQEAMELTDWQYYEKIADTPAGDLLADSELAFGWKVVPDTYHIGPKFKPIYTHFPRVNLRTGSLVEDRNGVVGRWRELYPSEARNLLQLENLGGYPITLIWDPDNEIDTRKIIQSSLGITVYSGINNEFRSWQGLSGFIG